MNLPHSLIHRAQIKRQSSANDGWGGMTPTSAVTISCFAYGADKREETQGGYTQPVDFEMWVSPTTSIAVNDTVESIVTPSGQTILASGIVIDMTLHDHPTLGEIARRALLARS